MSSARQSINEADSFQDDRLIRSVALCEFVEDCEVEDKENTAKRANSLISPSPPPWQNLPYPKGEKLENKGGVVEQSIDSLSLQLYRALLDQVQTQKEFRRSHSETIDIYENLGSVLMGSNDDVDLEDVKRKGSELARACRKFRDDMDELLLRHADFIQLLGGAGRV